MTKAIMTVDDSPSMRQMVRLTLATAGYQVVEAADGREALSRLQGPLSMIITDLNMPNMNGIELIREIRRQPAYKFVPIVLLTTESQDAKKQEAKQAGATGWIVKPFKPDQLLSVVAKLAK